MQPLDPIPHPLDHLILRGRPRDPALVDRDSTLDYAGLEHAVGALAHELADRLKPGDRVASWLPKTRIACILPLAAARAGLVHVPINPVLRHAQAEHIIADSGTAMLIANSARIDTLAISRTTSLVVDDEANEWLRSSDPLPLSDRDPRELAALLYTSGSTGRPKGVMLSHANMWLGSISVAHYLGLAANDRTLAVLPLAFDYGQNQLLSAWAAGGAAIPLDYLVPKDVIAAIGRHDVTTLAGVPSLWIQLMETKWPDEATTLHRITNSGGPMPRALLAQLRATLPATDIHLMYGLTEAFRSTSLPPDRVDEAPGSVGTAIPFADVMIVDVQGRPMADGEVGELVHAGPLVAGGYWRDETRTAERFRAAPLQSRYGGTAIWSGDRASRAPDGLITIHGRDDEMIKTSGNRVSPGEIEEAALASGAVAEAAAFGIPDARLGQAIVLIARARLGDPDPATRLREAMKQLPAHMQPKVIHWREIMPVGPNGKLDRVALRRELYS